MSAKAVAFRSDVLSFFHSFVLDFTSRLACPTQFALACLPRVQWYQCPPPQYLLTSIFENPLSYPAVQTMNNALSKPDKDMLKTSPHWLPLSEKCRRSQHGRWKLTNKQSWSETTRRPDNLPSELGVILPNRVPKMWWRIISYWRRYWASETVDLLDTGDWRLKAEGCPSSWTLFIARMNGSNGLSSAK